MIKNYISKVAYHKIELLIALFLILPLVIIFGAVGSNPLKLFIVTLIPLVVFFLLRFDIIYTTAVFFLFAKLYLVGFSLVTFIVILLLISFILTYKNISLKDFRSPVIFPFLFYFVTTLPSYLNNKVPNESIIESFNLLVFFILIALTVAAHNNPTQFKKYLFAFLLMVFINGLYLVYKGIVTDTRVFGFTGVMYVDYVGIGIILVVILTLFSSATMKIFYGIITLAFVVFSLFTQTRNAFLSIILTFLLLLVYLIRHSDFFSLQKKYLIIALIASAVLSAGVYVSLKAVNPEISERTEELAQSNQQVLNQEGTAANSLVSRFFIWTTALNAFSHNPFFGVGVYAFPYVSQNYNKLPQFIFDTYVKKKYPHLTALAVLAETGIVGAIGFLFLIYSIFKLSFGMIMMTRTRNEKVTSLLLIWSQVYILVSMLMTDAWFWDHGIVLWGMILGMIMSNRKFLQQKYS